MTNDLMAKIIKAEGKRVLQVVNKHDGMAMVLILSFRDTTTGAQETQVVTNLAEKQQQLDVIDHAFYSLSKEAGFEKIDLDKEG